MKLQYAPAHDVSLAIAIVMQENACGSHAAAALIQERATALGVPLDEVATTIVEIGHNRRQQAAVGSSDR